MITVEQALELVLARATRRDPRRVPLEEARGLVLAQAITSSIDSPPHDKAQVDGYAVRAADMTRAGVVLRVLEEITAGLVPTQPVVSGTATRIMTGAPVPDGADAVVMVERTAAIGSVPGAGLGEVRVDELPRAGQNIMRRGESLRAGDVVLQPGHRIRSIELGLLAELGVTQVSAISPPSVSVISTGNELVAAQETPQPGQIRNSNGPMLEALVSEAGGRPVSLGIVRDRLEDLTTAIRSGLESDVLLLSGGVSAGVLDLVPQVLKHLHVEQVFHKVRLKPGKPLWFGTLQRGAQLQLVFGLPGNPVSSLVCFQLFVRPALTRLAGRPDERVPSATARLVAPFQHRGDRPTFFPGRTRRSASGREVEPLRWRGSADLRTLADADVLICLEAGEYELAAGSEVAVTEL